MDSSTQMLVLIVALAVVAIGLVAVFAARASRTRRHRELKERFGPEYDRTVEHHQGRVEDAERELASRQRRIQEHKLKPLSDDMRAQYSADWRNVQSRFVDDPTGAIQAADELIQTVMKARGYADSRYDQRVADLSVEHAGVIQHYRAAHDLAEANREGRADTEALRQAVVHYRALFAALLDQSDQREPHKKLQEAHV